MQVQAQVQAQVQDQPQHVQTLVPSQPSNFVAGVNPDTKLVNIPLNKLGTLMGMVDT
jgi:hypothetical protein